MRNCLLGSADVHLASAAVPHRPPSTHTAQQRPQEARDQGHLRPFLLSLSAPLPAILPSLKILVDTAAPTRRNSCVGLLKGPTLVGWPYEYLARHVLPHA